MSRHRRQQHRRARRSPNAPAPAKLGLLTGPKMISGPGGWECNCPRINPPTRHKCKRCGAKLPRAA